MRIFIMGAAIAAAMFAVPVQAKTTQSMKCAIVNQANIDGLFTEFNNAWATKNPDLVTALFTKDAVLLATVSNKPRLSHVEIRDYFVTFLKGNPVGSINSSSYKFGCNIAARLGTWTVQLTDAATGTKTDVKVRYSFIYRLEEGRWKIDHLHSSMMPEKAG